MVRVIDLWQGYAGNGGAGTCALCGANQARPDRKSAVKKNRFGLMLYAMLTVLFLFGTAGTQKEPSRSDEEQGLLEKLNRYCRAAMNGQWEYRCVEKIQREEKKYEVVLTKTSFGENKRRWYLRKATRQAASYEYRLRLKGKRISERRLALSSDYVLLYEGKDVGAILPYKEKSIIFNPMEYLSRVTRGALELRPEGGERIGDFEARIVHFKSTWTSGERQGTLTGRMWVHPETGAVWRMSLEPESWRMFESEEIPKEYSAVPALGHPSLRRALSWTAEYEVEDQEVRFPNRIEIKEEYFDDSGERLTANSWEISYDEFQFGSGEPASPIKATNPVLEKAGAYCERLKTIALHYFCEEHIIRTSYLYSVREFVRSAGERPRKRWNFKRSVTQDVLYDYQLIKKGDLLEEKRKALKYNGKTWTRKEDPPNILPYQALYIIYGPVGFLSKYWQSRFDYFEKGSEKLPGDRTAVILTAQPNEFREENSVYGQVWVEPELGAVLRISWDPESIDFFHPEDIPEAFGGLEKRLVWTAYYEMEKNGIYFPSRQEIREEYVSPAGETTVGDVWTVTYENYKFFIVGVDVEIKK